MRGDLHPWRAVLRKTLWEGRNGWILLRSQSAFKVAFVLLFALAFEGGLVALFLDGFRFLKSLGGIGTFVLARLFSLLFLATGVMLALSGVVTAHATLFGSREVENLLTRPLRPGHIAVYRTLEAASLSSWAFGFVVGPFMLAYAWHEKVSPWFALWAVIFSIPFVLLCATVGALACLIIRRWGPRGRPARYIGAVTLLGLAVAAWARWRGGGAGASDLRFDLWNLVPGLRWASRRGFPSWWIAEGLQAVTGGETWRGLRLLGMLTAQALAGLLAVEWLGERIFLDAWRREPVRGSRYSRTLRSFRWLDALMAPLPPDVRALVGKDIRTFCRDASQWSQAVIFFGLLALYFSNLRSFRYHLLPMEWRNAIAFLNVFSVSSVVCSLGSRFIYPQLSLEGHGFWMLGLAPLSLRRVLAVKCALSAFALAGVSGGLMLLSTQMLTTSPGTRWLSLGLTVVIACDVAALSTGLGAVYPDLRQRNPAAIVSGFGGTLNLVLNLGVMLAIILPFAVLYHRHYFYGVPWAQLGRGLALAGLWAGLVGGIGMVVPFGIGVRSLRNREF